MSVQRKVSDGDVSLSGVTTAGIGTSPLDNSAVYVTGESLELLISHMRQIVVLQPDICK